MISIIASDLDETLLNTNKHVDAYTIEQIKKVSDHGIQFVCATGRPFISIQNTLKEIGLYDKKNTYTISLNGACVTENKNNRILYMQPMDHSLAEQIYKIGLQYDVCVQVYTIDTVYAYHLNDDERDFLKGRMQVKEIHETNLSFLKDVPIMKVLYENTSFDYLQSIDASLLTNIRQACDLSYSSARYFEFNKKGVHKGIGLKFLCDHLHIDIKDSMAIGDNINDLGMLKTAGIAIGVKNLHPLIKDQVDHICPYTHNENAVGHILHNYVLTKK